MDCHIALELLELAQGNSGDLDKAELAIAGAHVESCEHCESVYRSRQHFDIEIGRTMRDVSIPPGLKQRIRDALNEAERSRLDQTSTVNIVSDVDGAIANNDSLDAPELQRAVPFVRRTWFRVAASLATCVIVGVFVWQFWQPSGTSLSLEELQANTVLEVQNLPVFDGISFPAELPYGWEGNRSILIDSTAKGFSASGNATHEMALYGFAFRVSRSRSLSGVLLVIPKSYVQGAPTAKSLGSASIAYVRRGKLRFATAAWTDGNFVYICFVQGGANHLEEIQERLRIQPT